MIKWFEVVIIKVCISHASSKHGVYIYIYIYKNWAHKPNRIYILKSGCGYWIINCSLLNKIEY